MTFFDWPRIGPNVPGTGDISALALRVSGPDALDWWAARLTAAGLPVSDIEASGGRAALTFTDPEGQRLRLVDDGGAPGGVPWSRSPVPADKALRGLAGAALTVRRLERTAAVLTEVLGMRLDREYPRDGHSVSVFAMGPGGPGAEIEVVARPDLGPGRVGAGGVHHLAFRTPDADEQAAWQDRLQGAGLATSGLIDRYYFRSLYFREPGGILFEIATDGPGFASDEDPAHLGERLSLPPFLEPRRREIEAGLAPLAVNCS